MGSNGAQIKYDLSGERNRTGRTEAEGRGGALNYSNRVPMEQKPQVQEMTCLGGN